MELIVVHKKPLTSFLTGKWTINSSIIFCYVVIEGKRKEATLKDDVVDYIKTITIANSEVIGYYDRTSDAIEYVIDMDLYNLVMEEAIKFDNLYIIKFK